ELVYITALFGAWLRREGILDLVETRKRAVVVCANGISISNFLYFTLKELFPEIDFITCLSLRDFAEYDENNYDVIFTMVRVETTKKQFVVKPLMDEMSKKKFREKVMGELTGVIPHQVDTAGLMEIIRKHADVRDEEALKRELSSGLSPEPEETTYLQKEEVSIGLEAVLVRVQMQRMSWSRR